MSKAEQNRNATRTTSTRDAFRYGIAFAVGIVASFIGIVAAGGAAGMFAIIVLPIVSAMISGICVLISALVGRCFRFPALGRYWYGSFLPVACVVAIGLALYVFGMSSRQVAPGSSLEEPLYVLGWSYWPGYFILIFGVTNFPYSRFRESI